MDDAPLSPLIDYNELKRNIVEAIRATIRELAQEHNMTYDEYLDWYFGEEDE
jgi:hypothetical protein